MNRRRPSAQSLIEATIGIVVLVIVVITLIDLAMIIYGVSLNDSACGNAARASASGNPADAEHRAQAVLDQLNARQAGAIVSHFSLVPPVQVNIISEPSI